MSAEHRECVGCVLHQAGEVTRRDFISAATLSAVAAVLTACGGSSGDGGSTGPINPGVGTREVTLANFPALANVGSAVQVIPSPPVAMARTAAGVLIAYSLSCTHQGTTVNINSNFSLRCPNHGATYTSEGVWTGGQTTSSLVRLPVSLNSANTIATITLG
jgi:cytochrome b6-f complex iron-sulfur subunit